MDPTSYRPPQKNKRPKYQKRKSVYIDVDGVLLLQDGINVKLLLWIIKNSNKKGGDFTLVLWSARGADHALEVATMSGCSDCFEAILSKPGYIIDDQLWSWIQHVDNLNGEFI